MYCSKKFFAELEFSEGMEIFRKLVCHVNDEKNIYLFTFLSIKRLENKKLIGSDWNDKRKEDFFEKQT